MGFGLVIGFIEHLQIVTTSKYIAIANLHSAIHCSTHLSLLSVLCFHQFSGNGFQQWLLPPCSGSYRLATIPQLSTLDSINLTLLGWSSDIALEWTQQKNTVPLLMSVAWYHVFFAAALTAWCRTTCQHCFPQLCYCCVMSSRT
jgi:hypothetical protein